MIATPGFRYQDVASMTNVICVSAGMLAPKKQDTPIARAHLYLNYGLLGLGSILATSGYSPRIFHGQFLQPEDFVRNLFAARSLDPSAPLLLSVPSSFALPWARRACSEVRRVSPATRIIVGGRWVVADDETWIRGQLPDANEIFRGLAEPVIERLIRGPLQSELVSIGSQGLISAHSPTLNYDLLEHSRRFQPSIEVSRGCGMHCVFCAEAEEPLSSMLDPDILADEFVRLSEHYQTIDIHPYLEASFFRPSSDWIHTFRSALAGRKIQMLWRTETRVDAISPSQIKMLAESGLRVLDLGLESASHEQLLRMQKTTNPESYLRRASELLNACREAGIWTKVNVLLHPGETPETIKATEDWLERHRGSIKGMSVGPTILFRYGAGTDALLREFEAHGAHAIDEKAIDRDGFTHLHLSSEMSHEEARAESLRLSRSFMTERDYFDLKSFSYFPRDLSWPDFRAMLIESPNPNYSFRLS